MREPVRSRRSARPLLCVGLLLLLLGGCGTARSAMVEAPESGPPPAPATPAADADVRFIQDMIVHHQQALEMTELARERTTDPDILLLAQRIDLSQVDELSMMRRWLEDHGLTPDEHHSHAPGASMPGMLSDAQMARLAAASGDEFDRLFLDAMIGHHLGALAMVETLFAAGGAQNAEMYQIASHVDSDQRIEIARMRRMLAARR